MMCKEGHVDGRHGFVHVRPVKLQDGVMALVVQEIRREGVELPIHPLYDR